MFQKMHCADLGICIHGGTQFETNFVGKFLSKSEVDNLINISIFSEIVIGDYNGDKMDDIYCYENGTTTVSPSVIRREFLIIKLKKKIQVKLFCNFNGYLIF